MDKRKVTYVLMISKVFPKHHIKSGQETYFHQKIMLSVKEPDISYEIEGHGKYILDTTSLKNEIAFNHGWDPKIHTIRANYDLWSRRAEKINRGEAILSLREWSGEPYRSKQREFLRLEKIQVQRIRMLNLPMLEYKESLTDKLFGSTTFDVPIDWEVIAKNDGLSVEDMKAWFKIPDKQLMALIHFTDFKYY